MNYLKEIAQNALMRLPVVQRFAMRRHSTGLNNDEPAARKTYEFMTRFGAVKDKDVLELGPGQTLLLMHQALADGAHSCVAVDIADYFTARREEQKNVRLCIYDGQSIPLQSSSVDLIWSNDVFEHFRYPQDMVRECFRVLRSGGTMVAVVDVRDHYESEERKFSNNLHHPTWLWNLMKWNRSAFTNRVRYSEWLTMFDRIGFECVEKEPYVLPALQAEYRKRPDLQRWSEEDISARGFHVVLRKP
ncbi:MAG: class I SAM-dependent methyltransferase [Deltaproteobacteria bacterium]|nr:class I SAM-dependent methyltransferase [Deltaproteobacteria bacterium]